MQSDDYFKTRVWNVGFVVVNCVFSQRDGRAPAGRSSSACVVFHHLLFFLICALNTLKPPYVTGTGRASRETLRFAWRVQQRDVGSMPQTLQCENSSAFKFAVWVYNNTSDRYKRLECIMRKCKMCFDICRSESNELGAKENLVKKPQWHH